MVSNWTYLPTPTQHASRHGDVDSYGDSNPGAPPQQPDLGTEAVKPAGPRPSTKIRLAQNCSTGSRRPGYAAPRTCYGLRPRAHAHRGRAADQEQGQLTGRGRDNPLPDRPRQPVPGIDAAPLRGTPPNIRRDDPGINLPTQFVDLMRHLMATVTAPRAHRDNPYSQCLLSATRLGPRDQGPLRTV